MLDPYNVYQAKPVDDLFKRMQRCCEQTAPEEKLPAPDQLVLDDAVYGERLLNDLESFKGDRLIMMPGLSTHYVAFVKGKSGPWYLLNSAKREEKIKIEGPAAYLRLVYHGRNINNLSWGESGVSMILMKEEHLPGGG